MRLSLMVALAHSYSLEHVETVAIRQGLRLVERFSHSNYTLKSNCKGVINQLLARSGALSSLRHIHQQILSLIDKQSVVLSFVRCDANSPTHSLAT